VDTGFLNCYETELQHLREVCAEFSAANRVASSRLDLSDDPKHLTRDPYVNMLLQGSAFLAARVRHKMDAEFPKFTQGLLQVIYPQFLCPTPSMAMIDFDLVEGDSSLASGFVIPKNTVLRSQGGKGEKTACLFRTSKEVVLWPLRIAEAAYVSGRDLEELALPRSVPAMAALRIRLNSTGGATFDKIGGDPARGGRVLDELCFHIRDDGKGPERGPGRVASAILEQILTHCLGVRLIAGNGPARTVISLGPDVIRRSGFSPDEALLPVDPRSFSGFRLLREYFALPDRFLSFTVAGLAAHLRTIAGDILELIFLFSEEQSLLSGGDFGLRAGASNNNNPFHLFATPCINLFEREFDRVSLSDSQNEYTVHPDRSAMNDYEVYSLTRVTGYGAEPGIRREYRPFFLPTGRESDETPSYLLFREARGQKTRNVQFGTASDYSGSDILVSLVDPALPQLERDVREVGFRGLCTNRGLPDSLSGDGQGCLLAPVELSGPFRPQIRCLIGPTAPVEATVSDGSLWELIRHLSINYLSFGDSEPAAAAEALRSALAMYVPESRRQIRRQIDGIRSIHVASDIARLPVKGPMVYGRGVKVTVEFDEESFAGGSHFVFGMVLDEFFSRYVSINSFSQTIIRTRQRGEVTKWKPRVGWRQLV